MIRSRVIVALCLSELGLEFRRVLFRSRNDCSGGRIRLLANVNRVCREAHRILLKWRHPQRAAVHSCCWKLPERPKGSNPPWRASLRTCGSQRTYKSLFLESIAAARAAPSGARISRPIETPEQGLDSSGQPVEDSGASHEMFVVSASCGFRLLLD